ncbi:protein adenylyltransferase SelO [Solibacillus silvestris]|uniref:protein adenylyltransferase SelO n=1 Tax=Solibacillus silvestris TaxID=76853 RepID=UPI003F80C67A
MTEIDHNFGFRFNNSYLKLPQIFYSNVEANEAAAPLIVIFNRTLAESLGLHVQQLREHGAVILAGHEMPEDAAQIAQAYAGHQFGHFNMLGDGRALLLGEHITSDGERVDIQLKGSGRTPYSRGGDGRAALGPMLREFIISEAMHALSIPTTRSLAVTTTGEVIYREKALEGGVLTRIAASHLRVGTFQFAASFGEKDELKALADYAIERHYPELQKTENRYIALLEKVMEKQAELIAKWQSVGFIHGVMNTDNMTISGETIDYGPCAFMGTFNQAAVFSSIDKQGRYAYGNQPPIAAWNLTRFAESLLPIIHDDEDEAIRLAQYIIGKFPSIYEAYYYSEMREKLGILTIEEQDEALILQLLDLMEQHEADYTKTFRALTEGQNPNNALFQSEAFRQWELKWHQRLEQQGTTLEEARGYMAKVNPIVIPRNHLVEQALDEFLENKPDLFLQMLQAVANPYRLTDPKFTEPPTDDEPPFVSYCGT